MTILTFSITQFHQDGGTIFMYPLSTLLLINVCLIIYQVTRIGQKKSLVPKQIEIVKQIGLLAAAFGALCTILGLFEAFGALSRGNQVWPFQVIMGGMKVALITALYGLLIYCISLFAYILLQLTSTKSNQ